jgi:hypothetical protein
MGQGKGLERVALPSCGDRGYYPWKFFQIYHPNMYILVHICGRMSFFEVSFSICFYTKHVRAKMRSNDAHENAQIYRLIANSSYTIHVYATEQCLMSAFIQLR